jgi:hypothetical protein
MRAPRKRRHCRALTDDGVVRIPSFALMICKPVYDGHFQGVACCVLNVEIRHGLSRFAV